MSVKAPVTTFHETQFAALRADIAELRELIERILLPLLQAIPRERLTVAEAAAAALRTEQTITRWCRQDRIGTLVHGRWSVDKAHLKQLMIDRFGASHLPPGLR
jgi:chorismate mutase